MQTRSAFTLAGELPFFFTNVYFLLLLEAPGGQRLVLSLTTCQKEHLQN